MAHDEVRLLTNQSSLFLAGRPGFTSRTPTLASALFLKWFSLIVAGPSSDFSGHSRVRPRVFHGRTKRQITSTKENVSTTLYSVFLSFSLR